MKPRALYFDYFPIAFISLLNRVLVNPFYRDHSAAKIALEGRLGSVQLRRVTLPCRISKAESVAYKF
jgi:hypothetical protein